eukprot:symbB.v1.2.001810.t1/scaffold97.1/size333048/14
MKGTHPAVADVWRSGDVTSGCGTSEGKRRRLQRLRWRLRGKQRTSAQTTVSSVSQDASAVEHSPPGLRDQLSLLSPWYFVELPWRQLQLPAHKALDEAGEDGQLGGIVAARVQSAMDTACHALKCTGIKEAESNCPEVIVFKPLPGMEPN